jgi:hypothetical protein
MFVPTTGLGETFTSLLSFKEPKKFKMLEFGGYKTGILSF